MNYYSSGFYKYFAPNGAKVSGVYAHRMAEPPFLPIMIISLQQGHASQIISHARECAPHECCGLVGGNEARAQTIYPLRNVAADPLVTYEASPEDLFAAQRSMRERGEQLLAIYHSHPRSADPKPSDTDVRLAYYPSAVYFIVGLGGEQPSLGAFRISESEGRWEAVEYEVVPARITETEIAGLS